MLNSYEMELYSVTLCWCSLDRHWFGIKFRQYKAMQTAYH
jgi:hypothetical protein